MPDESLLKIYLRAPWEFKKLSSQKVETIFEYPLLQRMKDVRKNESAVISIFLPFSNNLVAVTRLFQQIREENLRAWNAADNFLRCIGCGKSENNLKQDQDRCIILIKFIEMLFYEKGRAYNFLHAVSRRIHFELAVGLTEETLLLKIITTASLQCKQH